MIEDLLREIRSRKLFVSNCYEGRDGLWRCFLRDRKNALPSIHQGTGKTMETAMRAALPAPADEFEDLLG